MLCLHSLRQELSSVLLRTLDLPYANTAKASNKKTIQFKDGCTATCFYCPQWGHMQVAQRVDGHILPAIDGQEANWMRDVELLLIASVPGG
ncbi:MAG: hypothetical protein C0469_03005 [Cyanobacteria bacterium DS2.3.42]|nr:hypothetical protein [Cyanobacteria bacterium DS2.3.42]